MDEFTVVEFGLDSVDHNWRLLQFIDKDLLSRMHLTPPQIDGLATCLNWDILSTKYLPGWIFVKYKDLINWDVFLNNGHKKELIYLIKVRDKMRDNQNIFFIEKNKAAYYTPMFMSAFPELVDWNWCGRNLELSEYIILRHWNKISINIICKHQKLTEKIMREKVDKIKWRLASKNKMSEEFIEEFSEYFHWDQICKYQTLSAKFLDQHMLRCSHSATLSRYQKLPGWFIRKHRSLLDMTLVSRYQDMSVDFLRVCSHILDRNALAKNINYNKPNTIQVFQQFGRTYIIDAPIVNNNASVIFCNTEQVIS